MILPTVAALAAAYLLGAVPFGVIISRLWSGIDIRQYGSGNIGATNVLRVLGPVPGVLVMATDVLKGLGAVWIARGLFGIQDDSWALIGVALLAIIGHNWSVFLGFAGGKGANTSLGVVFGLDWRAALICFAVWIVVVAITRIVSVGSMLGTIALPVALWALHRHHESAALLAFGVVAAVFSVHRHRSNIKRLLAGTEPRFGQRVEVPAGPKQA